MPTVLSFPSQKHPRRRTVLYVILFILLLLFLCPGSLLFQKTATAVTLKQGYELSLKGGSPRPPGFFSFSGWTLSRNGQMIFQGGHLSGTYLLGFGKRFRLHLKGKSVLSGPAFPKLFPAHHEKIPDIELHRFALRSTGIGLTRRELEKTLQSELDLDIRSISLESSALCRKIYDNTGVRLDQYLKFESGQLHLSQHRRTISVRSLQPLTGPYQILQLKGEAGTDPQKIHMSLTFGLQPKLIRKMQNRNFFKYLIPENWDSESPIFLPAPVILTGSFKRPRIDVGKIFRQPPATAEKASGHARERVHLKLKKVPGSRKYRLQLPTGTMSPHDQNS